MSTKKITKTERVIGKRIACLNWDKNVATVRLDKKCDTFVSRKVFTKDIRRFSFTGREEMIAALRQGFEVRFTDAKGADMLRFFPCVEKDYKTMFVSAQTMGDFRKEVYADKKVSFIRGGKVLDSDEAKKTVKKIVEVTPDIMATCPNCGTKFRVGKKK